MYGNIERAFWIGGLIAQALILLRLYRLGQLRHYRFLAAWSTASILRVLILFPFPLNSTEYATLWLIVRPPTWILTILAVVEISNHAFQGFSGISALVRRFNWGASIIAVAIAWGTVQSTWGEPVYLYRVFLRVGQVVDLSATAFLLMLMLLLQFFPMPVGRNLVRHATFFAVLMLTQMAALFYEMLSTQLVTREVSLYRQIMSTALLFAWPLAFTADGERIDHRPAEDAEESLVSSLTAINAALSPGSSRRRSA